MNIYIVRDAKTSCAIYLDIQKDDASCISSFCNQMKSAFLNPFFSESFDSNELDNNPYVCTVELAGTLSPSGTVRGRAHNDVIYSCFATELRSQGDV